jgi:hypothetical protein
MFYVGIELDKLGPVKSPNLKIYFHHGYRATLEKTTLLNLHTVTWHKHFDPFLDKKLLNIDK